MKPHLPTLLILLALASRPAAAAEPGLPLPDAPGRVLIPDVSAFDQALEGAFRKALTGAVTPDDPLAAAWRKTQVGSKLEAQWTKLAGDLPWTWDEIVKLRPGALALALMDVGQLEAVLVLETPLPALPRPLAPGETRSHGGVAYHLVTRGAADGSADPERRLGLAYAQTGGRLFVATSARALELALDAALAGRRFAPPLAGLLSLELDLDALRQDRYFKREFLFGGGPERGRLHAALRREGARLVEVRAGLGEPLPEAAVFDLPSAAAAGWEPDGATLLPALRAALLEPLPVLADKPVPALAALPQARKTDAEDRYLVDLERPPFTPGAPAFEEGELGAWRELLGRHPVAGWGYALEASGTRRLVFDWPEPLQAELEQLCRRTLERRAGRALVKGGSDAREIQVGPGLPALALKRTGAFVWIGPSAAALAAVPTPRRGGEIVRWARLDLDAVRAQGPRWAKVEGPASPERVRPFSDRILGLLGWIPATHSLAVERRRTAGGFTEKLFFGAQ